MSGWQAGDLALCVKTSVWRGDVNRKVLRGPKAGAILTVSWAGTSRTGRATLEFADFETPRNPSGTKVPWCASRFRKITPPPADAFDREIIDLMAGKPVPAEPVS